MLLSNNPKIICPHFLPILLLTQAALSTITLGNFSSTQEVLPTCWPLYLFEFLSPKHLICTPFTSSTHSHGFAYVNLFMTNNCNSSISIDPLSDHHLSSSSHFTSTSTILLTPVRHSVLCTVPQSLNGLSSLLV